MYLIEQDFKKLPNYFIFFLKYQVSYHFGLLRMSATRKAIKKFVLQKTWIFPFNFYTVFQFYYWQKCIRIYIKLCFFRKITLVHVIHQFLELLHGALARSWITRSIMSEVINLVRNGIKRLNVGEFHLPTGLRDCLICCFLPFVC